jgi:hypothetical protein
MLAAIITAVFFRDQRVTACAVACPRSGHAHDALPLTTGVGDLCDHAVPLLRPILRTGLGGF